MNERIRELRAKAQELAGQEHHTGRALDLKGMEQVPDFQIFMDRVHTSYEKFAELIVLECSSICYKTLENGDEAASLLMNTFGVEE